MDLSKVNFLINNPLRPNPAEWAMDAEDALVAANMMSDEARRHIDNIKSHNGAFPQHNDAVVALLKRVLKTFGSFGNSSSASYEPVVNAPVGAGSNGQYSVFIIHGHDATMKSEVARLLEQQGIDAVILGEQAPTGLTIIEKLEYYAKQSTFAIVLYSKDDTTDTGERARQNVVFEHGLFVGHLGRNRVIALKNGDVEGYSDIAGIEYIHYEDSDWRYKLINSLKIAGFDVSLDKIKA